jgi:hypothetical protein
MIAVPVRVARHVARGLRVDELARADVADLGHDRGHRILTVARKGGHRIALVLPPATTAALDAHLATRAATPAVATAADRVASRAAVASTNMASAEVAGPLLATNTGGRLDQAALWHLVRRLARAAGIEHTGPRCHRTRCGTPRSHWRWTPGRPCGTCRISPGTETREPLGATTDPATAWTATPPTPWPRTSPESARL